jgi:hypothetical protein
MLLSPFTREFLSSNPDVPDSLAASSFSPFSNRSLIVVLESGSILARVALLPNESYAGRADNVLNTGTIPTGSTHPPGSLRPGTFLIGTSTLNG